MQVVNARLEGMNWSSRQLSNSSIRAGMRGGNPDQKLVYQASSFVEKRYQGAAFDSNLLRSEATPR